MPASPARTHGHIGITHRHGINHVTSTATVTEIVTEAETVTETEAEIAAETAAETETETTARAATLTAEVSHFLFLNSWLRLDPILLRPILLKQTFFFPKG